MGSVAGGAVAIAAEGKDERGSRRERRRLSRQMARLMNCSRVLPSSRQPSSDCSFMVETLAEEKFERLRVPPSCLCGECTE